MIPRIFLFAGENVHHVHRIYVENMLIENMLAEYVWNAFEDEEEQRSLHLGILPRTRSSIDLRNMRLSLL